MTKMCPAAWADLRSSRGFSTALFAHNDLSRARRVCEPVKLPFEASGNRLPRESADKEKQRIEQHGSCGVTLRPTACLAETWPCLYCGTAVLGPDRHFFAEGFAGGAYHATPSYFQRCAYLRTSASLRLSLVV